MNNIVYKKRNNDIECICYKEWSKSYAEHTHTNHIQIQCRVRTAQKLLQEGKTPIEVACEIGFCDVSHFDRCFQKIVKLTPLEYKASLE